MTIKIIQPRTTYKTVDNFGVLPHFGKYIDVKTIQTKIYVEESEILQKRLEGYVIAGIYK